GFEHPAIRRDGFLQLAEIAMAVSDRVDRFDAIGTEFGRAAKMLQRLARIALPLQLARELEMLAGVEWIGGHGRRFYRATRGLGILPEHYFGQELESRSGER